GHRGSSPTHVALHVPWHHPCDLRQLPKQMSVGRHGTTEARTPSKGESMSVRRWFPGVVLIPLLLVAGRGSSQGAPGDLHLGFGGFGGMPTQIRSSIRDRRGRRIDTGFLTVLKRTRDPLWRLGAGVSARMAGGLPGAAREGSAPARLAAGDHVV